jgi:hypothetical protein
MCLNSDSIMGAQSMLKKRQRNKNYYPDGQDKMQ